MYDDIDEQEVINKIGCFSYSKLIGLKYRNEVLEAINETAIKDYIMDVSLSISEEERIFIKNRISGYYESLKELNLDVTELGSGVSMSDITIALIYIKSKLFVFEK